MGFRDLMFGDVHSAAHRGSACAGCSRSCQGCAGALAGLQDDRALVRVVQTALANLARQYDPGDPMYTGLNPGNIDGIYGKNTQRAVTTFQGAKGLTPNGQLDAATLQALGIQAPANVTTTRQDFNEKPRLAPAAPPAPPAPASESSTPYIIAGAGAAALGLLMWRKRRRS